MLQGRVKLKGALPVRSFLFIDLTGFSLSPSFGIITFKDTRERLKLKSLTIKLILFLNYICIILTMGKILITQSSLSVQHFVPLMLATLFLGDITYIAACNLKENMILFLFCGLLAVDSWYLIFAAGPMNISEFWFRLFSPVMLYLSVRFCLIFLFQGYKYKMKKATDSLLAVFCICAIACVFLTERIYACTYGLQLIGSIACFLLVVLFHRKRVAFVLKSEKKSILLSLAVTLAFFIIYYFLTIDVKDHIGNFGVYIVVLIFFMSIHGIVLKETDGVPISAVISFKEQLLLAAVGTGILISVCIVLNWPVTVFILLLNLALAFIFLFNIILGENLKHNNHIISRNSKYTYALNRLKHEEELKETFSNFLHDEVLQDLLSIKNMLGKSNRPEVQDLIQETLNRLNIRIRSQMQDYHPVLLKSLTLKENLNELIQSIRTLFPQRDIDVSFECSDTLFIPEPYDMLVYRLIKELLTNIYKHSNGNHAWIILSLEKDIVKLYVCDNGKRETLKEVDNNDPSLWHKGLLSMKEQIDDLGGIFSVSDNIPQGVRTEIQFLVKGDVSYKHFVS